jgi:hypothetical protein
MVDAVDVDAAFAGVCSWRALSSHWLDLPTERLADPRGARSWAWAGQVFSRRSLHRDLLFFSLCTDGSGGAHGGVEVLLRRDVIGDTAMDEAYYTYKCGAVLRVEGAAEGARNTHGRPLLVATRVEHVAAFPAGQVYDIAASPPQPPCLGLPSDYAERVAGPEAAADAAAVAAAAAAAAAARPSPPPPPLLEENFSGVSLHVLCKHWVAARLAPAFSCRSRVGCRFAHVLPPGAPPAAAVCAAWKRWRARVKRAAAPRARDDDAGPPEARAPHSERGNVFGEWLLAHAAPAALRGGVVLDVAGGRGDLAAALARAGVRVVTVDPRPAKPTKAKARAWAAAAAAADAAAADAGTPPPCMPEHLLELFDDAFVASHAALVAGVSLIVGFHPDEATEPIVDYALKAGLPVAVVPCCVCSRAAPGRRLASGGGPVHSVAQFVACVVCVFVFSSSFFSSFFFPFSFFAFS